ncbi:hypothetical protein EDB89DRAFT_2155910 [Lactarius sanguifluus]|nr:hypothetical protein EDB89DRAFT_2155910 [Lactarius sanguifluus]
MVKKPDPTGLSNPSGGRVISVSKATPRHPLTCPRLETRKPRHRITAGIPTAATLWTLLPLRCHHLNTPDSDAATSTPPPPPSHRHLDTSPNSPEARAVAASTTTATDHHLCQQCHHVNNLHILQPAAVTSNTTITTATDHHLRQQRHRHINLSHQTAINATATAPTPHATPPQSTPPPSHHTNPVLLNRPGPTSSLPVL